MMERNTGGSSAAASSDKRRFLSTRGRWEFPAPAAPERIAAPAGLTSRGRTQASGARSSSVTSMEEQENLVYTSAMNMAKAPLQQMFATAFMLWMSGKALGIFSIMMLVMAFSGPVRGIMNFTSAFKKYEQSSASLALPKLVYLALNLAGLGVALYKCHVLGLLPTGGPSEIVSNILPQQEFTMGAVASN